MNSDQRPSSVFPNRRRFLNSAALSLAAGLAGSCSRRRAAEEDEPGVELEVMSFNLRYRQPKDGDNYWDNRVGAVTQVIRTWNPAVVGLQEAERPMLNDILPALPEWGEIGVGRSDGFTGGEYCAILYRRDLLVPVDSATFWLSDKPEVAGSRTWGPQLPRICTWARFRHRESGRHFYHFNTHLDHEVDAARRKGARLIAERIQSRRHADPVILTGDFNAREGSDPVEFLKGRTPDASLSLRDTFRVVHPDVNPAGTVHGWRGGLDHAKIDYIFVEPETRVLDAAILHEQVDGRWPSDHYPIRARIRLV